MRVVPDTNVLVSAIVFGGPPGEIMALAAARQLQLILSPPLISELRRVLREKFEFSDDALYLAETLVRRAGIVVEPDRTLVLITEDPEDNRVLEAAAEGKVDAIISGDRHLLTLKAYEGIPIMSPRQFLDRLG
jgi:putative PIN family toxin of toxin-antitoxin system